MPLNQQQLQKLQNRVSQEQLLGLEAKVWQKIESQPQTTTPQTTGMAWCGAALVIVLMTGGMVGAQANAAKADPALIAFSNTPVYSVMNLVKD
ncbi:hypothetical protein MNBD_ALPHA06-1832 [hydrothermal vent metagenome]|uniref:Uncharacterized protein n=1 Tax=hydrothermal vent metagenome TaxID=652676 RepID=A0A3B0RIJ6_9ZZZZ